MALTTSSQVTTTRHAPSLYCDLAARAALDGMSAQLGAAGVDMGEMEEVAEELPLPRKAAEAAAEEAPAAS